MQQRTADTRRDGSHTAGDGGKAAPTPQSLPRPRRSKLMLALVTLALLAGGGYFAWSRYAAPQDKPLAAADTQPAVPVHAATVTRGDFPIVLDGLGTVQAWNSVTVRSRVDGQVERIAFAEGQTVDVGDVLVELDARPFQAALDQATAKIAQDEANLTSAESDLARTASLQQNGYATKQLFDQQTATVNQLNALIKADQAAEQNARVSLGYTTIRAPIAGVIGLRSIDIGNIVHAADQGGIVTIAEIQPIAVLFTAPEDELPAINRALKEGPLDLTALSSDGKTELGRGKLAIINNDIDIASGTIRLKGRFDNPDKQLWPGLSVTTRLLVSTLRDKIVVSDIAVQRGPTGLFAYVVGEGDKVEKRDLKVGEIGNGAAVIDSGLQPGERVVTSGHARLQPGSRVKVTLDEHTGKDGKPVDTATD